MGELANKLIPHANKDIKHLGVMNTMATVREVYLISYLCAKVKKVINDYKRCSNGSVALIPNQRQTTVQNHQDRLSTYKISKKEQGKINATC